MDIIIKSRGHGKTRDLIKMSSENNIPIVSLNPNYIKDMARNMGLSIPEPISYSSHLHQMIKNINPNSSTERTIDF